MESSLARRGLPLALLLLLASPALAAPLATAEFHDASAWFVHARVLGARATGTACPGDAPLASAALGLAGGGETTAAATGAGCVALAHAFTATAPGLRVGHARATGADGLAVADGGAFDVQVLPFDTATVPGFPPLGALPEPDAAMPVFLEMLMRTDGSVRAYRVAYGGSTVVDTLSSAFPGSGDRIVRVELGTLASEARVVVDGATLWAGPVAQADSAWWHVRPLH